ncbi:4'-phosphopantetheinyl transferase family protein [Latilactobacillus sakei]|uniref:4'-phosphopantetheinyl transferase family protein n=1 Tax=Latilactobacillus sakei TaxID=1599 RepID=UPI0020300C29|nr:4'-phosphopantetheinyl transferase superfamily protein [Latilactobacillus sakei]MCM1635777.1 4'-phosphopantetheinyl transferase superfamily protein [Latilactobacillus sakei]
MRKIVGRMLISRAYNIDFGNIMSGEMLQFNKYGKPSFIDKNNDFFTISHSGDIVVMSKSKVPVGIDIEKKRELNINFIRKAFTSAEYENILNAHNMSDRALDIWTQKESFLKLLGTGLAIQPRNVETKYNFAVEQSCLEINKEGLEENRGYIYEIGEIEDYICHLAVNETKDNVCINVRPVENLISVI